MATEWFSDSSLTDFGGRQSRTSVTELALPSCEAWEEVTRELFERNETKQRVIVKMKKAIYS